MAAVEHTRPKAPLIYNPKVRSIAYQVVLCAVIVFLAWSAIHNAAENLARAKIASGFGFWENTAGFDISQTLIEYQATSTYGRAFWVGLINTLLVAGLGIVLATILGFLIGIARLSKNWLLARMAGFYVETIRNIPLLLQLLFWYNAVLKALPGTRESLAIPGGGFLNNRGLFLPQPVFEPAARFALIALVLGVVASIGYRAWARRRQMRTGQQAPVLWVTLGLVIALPLAVLALSGFPISFNFPEAGRFNMRGGIEVLPEFMALLFGLVIYTAAFIAEVVRAGIRSVSQGPDRGRLCARAAARSDLAPRGHSAGDARDHSAADQPVSQPDQELHARCRHRLSGPRADFRRHGAEPDRPGGRGDRHHHGGLSHHQPRHLGADELLQPPHGAG